MPAASSYYYMQQQPDDISVIQMILQGQQNAYAILVGRYQSYVFTLVLRYINDRGRAEELAQDVFVKAYRCLADFKGNSKFSTWLYTIVNTTCISHLRKRKDETILPGHEQILSLTDRVHVHEHEVRQVEIKSRRAVLAKAMGALPPEDARIITLFYQAEQSLEEIAAILGITSNNVKVKLWRARQKLREALGSKFMNELI